MFSPYILYVLSLLSCNKRDETGDRCADVFSALSRADNGLIGEREREKKKCSSRWNSRAHVNFRTSDINLRDVGNGAVSLAFVCPRRFLFNLDYFKRDASDFFSRDYFYHIFRSKDIFLSIESRNSYTTLQVVRMIEKRFKRKRKERSPIRGRVRAR